jgi:hypothetical protein
MDKTPAQKWSEEVLEYRKTCQKILGISDSIRYVGAINNYGRTLAGIIRPGTKPLLNQEDAKNEFFIISNLITMRNSQAKSIGSLDHAVFKHKKVFVVCIPRGKIFYYISIDINTKSLPAIIRKITRTL